MADGNVPDITQQLLQMQSLIASSNGGGKGSPLLAGLLPGGGRDVDVGASLSIKGKGLNADNNICRLPQARPGLIESLKQQLGLKGGQIFDDIKKCGQGVAAMYTGDLPSGAPIGAPMGGGFVDNLGPRGGMTLDV